MDDQHICAVHRTACPGTPHHKTATHAQFVVEVAQAIKRRRDAGAPPTEADSPDIVAIARARAAQWAARPCRTETPREQQHRRTAEVIAAAERQTLHAPTPGVMPSAFSADVAEAVRGMSGGSQHGDDR